MSSGKQVLTMSRRKKDESKASKEKSSKTPSEIIIPEGITAIKDISKTEDLGDSVYFDESNLKKVELMSSPVMSREGKVFTSYILDRGIVGDHIEGFDVWIRERIPRQLEQYKIKLNEKNKKRYVTISDPEFCRPSIVYDGITYDFIPVLARGLNETYAARMYVTLTMYEENGKRVDSFKMDREFIKIPIMVHSEFCYLRGLTDQQLIEIKECPKDVGSYFIIKGSESFYQLQDRLRADRVILKYNKKKDTLEVRTTLSSYSSPKIMSLSYDKRKKIIGMTLNQLNSDDKNKSLFVEVTTILAFLDPKCNIFLDYVVPYTSDNPERINRIAHELHFTIIETRKKGNIEEWFRTNSGIVTSSIDEGFNYNELRAKIIRGIACTLVIPGDVAEFFTYLQIYKNYRTDGLSILEDRFHGFVREFFVEQLEIYEKKMNILAFMMIQIAENLAGYRLIDDMDSWTNKEVATPAKSMEINFRKIIDECVKNIEKKLEKLETQGYIDLITVATHIDEASMSKKFYQTFTTKWGSKTKGDKSGLSEILNRDSFPGIYKQLTRISADVFKKTQARDIRSVQLGQAGYVCVSETPEGVNCGIVKSKSTGVRITVDRFAEREKIKEYIKDYIIGVEKRRKISSEDYKEGSSIFDPIRKQKSELGSLAPVLTGDDSDRNKTLPVIFNGDFFGWVDGELLRSNLVDIRRLGEIHPETSISIFRGALYIYTTGSRPTRPLAIIEDGELLLDKYIREGKKVEGEIFSWEMSFKNMVKGGAIEYLDPMEQEQKHILITTSMRNIEINKMMYDSSKKALLIMEKRIKGLEDLGKRIDMYSDPLLAERLEFIREENIDKIMESVESILEGLEYKVSRIESLGISIGKEFFKDPRKTPVTITKNGENVRVLYMEDMESFYSNEVFNLVDLETKRREELDNFLTVRNGTFEELKLLLDTIREIPREELKESRKTLEGLRTEVENELTERELATEIEQGLNDIKINNMMEEPITKGQKRMVQSIKNEIGNFFVNVDSFFIKPSDEGSLKTVLENYRKAAKELTIQDRTISETTQFSIINPHSIKRLISEAKVRFLVFEERMKRLKKPYTHSEIDPSTILGLSASLIPFPERTQAPRNTYSCAQMAQGLGVYHSNVKYRFDTTIKLLSFPTNPLVTTQMYNVLGIDKIPSTKEVILAIGVPEGGNQEDSLVMNKNSIDLGLFRSEVLKTYSDSLINSQNIQYSYENPVKTSLVISDKKKERYHVLQDNGLPRIGEYINDGDYIIGKVGRKRSSENTVDEIFDSSIAVPMGEGGIVDTIWKSSTEGQKLIKVKIRQVRDPIISDKFASRSAQKGTGGSIVHPSDLPFTQDGLVPDMFINPLAIPSRMTTGKLIEMLAGPLSLFTGEKVDATAFRDFDIDDLRAKLKERGFRQDGKKLFYSGTTGEKIPCEMFIGTCAYQALKHMVADKWQARATGSVKLNTRTPPGGRHAGGINNCGASRLGVMELHVLISHGASAIVQERFMNTSDPYEEVFCTKCGEIARFSRGQKRGDKIIKDRHSCPVCGEEKELRRVKMPYAMHHFTNILSGANINIKYRIKDAQLFPLE